MRGCRAPSTMCPRGWFPIQWPQLLVENQLAVGAQVCFRTLTRMPLAYVPLFLLLTLTLMCTSVSNTTLFG